MRTGERPGQDGLPEEGREYAADDPKLWAEIKANGNATIMAIGH